MGGILLKGGKKRKIHQLNLFTLLATKMFNRALIAYPELHGSLAEAKPSLFVPLL